MRRKRTRANILHPENVRLALAYLRENMPQLSIFRHESEGTVYFTVQEFPDTSVSWRKWGIGTRAAAITDAAEAAGWDFAEVRRQRSARKRAA